MSGTNACCNGCIKVSRPNGSKQHVITKFTGLDEEEEKVLMDVASKRYETSLLKLSINELVKIVLKVPMKPASKLSTGENVNL